jgi:isopentenyl-diphosphate delta-isomerase
VRPVPEVAEQPGPSNEGRETIDDLQTAPGAALGDGTPEGDAKMVVLVDVEGNVLGESGKLQAHEAPGALHLAYSVFIYRSDGSMLLQQRAAGKYHFPLVWANACCSHPAPGEDLVASASRRVREELGLEVELSDVGSFLYRAVDVASGLVEHELDHVLVGETDAEPSPDPAEVAAVGWYRVGEVMSPLCPLRRAPWLAPALRVAERARTEQRRAAAS